MDASLSSDEDSTEIYRGHFDQCIGHLARRLAAQAPTGSRNAAKGIFPLVTFCNVDTRSAERWLRDVVVPRGEPFFKLMCYLDSIGYRVIELENTPQVRRSILELVGYSILTPQQLTSILGYKRPSILYRILAGRASASKDVENKMWGLFKERREDLARKKRDVRPVDGETMSVSAPVVPVPEPNEEAVKPRATVEMFVVSAMKGLLDLLDGVSDETILDHARSESSMILRLSERLRALTSRLIRKEPL